MTPASQMQTPSRTPSRTQSSHPRRQRLDHLAAGLVTFVTCLALCLPGDSIPPLEDDLPWSLPPHADKLVHGLLFFIETLCLYRSVRWWPKLRRSDTALPKLGTAVFLAILLALTTEWLQGQIPQRNTDGLDLVANFAGILAFVLFHVLRRPSPPSPDATESAPNSS